MKKKTDKPIGNLKRVDDFLPPPEALVTSDETRKITLLLDSTTIEAFKSLASQHGTKYQRMMREVLKGYAKKYGA